jgi:hypothetical protein
MTMNYELTTAIYELMNTIKADYYRWTSRNGTRQLTEVNKRMIDEFNASISFENGRKYVKIVNGGSVWGFVVKESDNKFKAGDILKAASWSSPVRNASRGNIFSDYAISWTGPNYLR